MRRRRRLRRFRRAIRGRVRRLRRTVHRLWIGLLWVGLGVLGVSIIIIAGSIVAPNVLGLSTDGSLLDGGQDQATSADLNATRVELLVIDALNEARRDRGVALTSRDEGLMRDAGQTRP